MNSWFRHPPSEAPSEGSPHGGKKGVGGDPPSVPRAAVPELPSPSELIDRYTDMLLVDKSRLGHDLLGRIPEQAELVVRTLRALFTTDRDDVSLVIASSATDAQLRAWGRDAGGQRVLHEILAELSTGYLGDDEIEQRDRIMSLVPDDRPGVPERPGRLDALGLPNAEACARIEEHSALLGLRLDRESLGRSLARRPPDWPVIEAVVDALENEDRAEVAAAFVSALDSGDLHRHAREPGVRSVLRRLVHEMRGVAAGEQRVTAMKAVMRALAGAHDAVHGADSEIELEVITFLYGGSPEQPSGGLDRIGAFLGTRGHTVLSVGDDIHSFEFHWVTGHSRGSYLAQNRWRDAIGQVVRVSPAEARHVRDALNDACGTGVYGLSGDICTGAAARALSAGLENVEQGSWYPADFAAGFDAEHVIRARRFYPQTARPRGPYRPSQE